jgi:hypothetical protein
VTPLGYYYILDDDGEPVSVDDGRVWAAWFETAQRVVQQDRFGTILVSTVFLGLDHRFGAPGPPVLWESMVFGGALDGEQRRYTTKADAIAGHAELCALVQLELSLKGEA